MSVGDQSINRDPADHEIIACIGTVPHRALDFTFLQSMLKQISPHLVVLDSHPGIRFTGESTKWLTRNRRVWAWAVNAASLGEPQARERNVLVSTRITDTYADNMSPLFIFDVILPARMSEFLTSAECRPIIQGGFKIFTNSDFDVLQPVPLGWVNMDKMVVRGLKVTYKGENYVVCSVNNSVAAIQNKSNQFDVKCTEVAPLPTRYQVYSQEGVTFPLGLPYPPSGMGRTIFYDVTNNKIRALSELECWLVAGGGGKPVIWGIASRFHLNVFIECNDPCHTTFPSPLGDGYLRCVFYLHH